jgi:hypothetical protein
VNSARRTSLKRPHMRADYTVRLLSLHRIRRVGRLSFLLTRPVVRILAFLMTWHTRRDLDGISRLARETLVLVPLGLPFFVPLALASVTVGLWLWLGPETL